MNHFKTGMYSQHCVVDHFCVEQCFLSLKSVQLSLKENEILRNAIVLGELGLNSGRLAPSNVGLETGMIFPCLD